MSLRVLDDQGKVTQEYRRLKDPRDKYRWVAEAYNREYAKSEPDLLVVQDLYSEALKQRAMATMLFPVWDATHNLSLFDLEGRKLVYSPNPVQTRIHQLVEEFRRKGLPLKLLLPKSRRHGVTEGVSKIIYPFIARRDNVKALIVAQADPEAEEIFRDKYKYVHENDPFGPTAKRSNTTILDFADNGSQIAVRSAGGRKGVGRGSGHIALHLSECAWYPGTARDVSTLISSLVAGMPKTNIGARGEMERVFTMVFAESTGNGQQGWFYEKCMRAHNKDEGRVDGEIGDEDVISGWQMMFFPWFERWNAVLPFVTEYETRQLGTEKAAYLSKVRAHAFMKTLDEEEQLLRDTYDLTAEQLHWRRDTLLHDIEGTTEEERNRMFKQEHPSNMIECFQPAGGMAFPVEKVSQLYTAAKDPAFVGKLISPVRMYDPLTSSRIPNTPMPSKVPDADGWYFEYEAPKPGHDYVIGSDLAKGTVSGDWSTAVVFDQSAREFVAYIRGKLSVDQMVEPVRLLSRYFNNARINAEENYGAHLIEEMKKCDRLPHLYWRHSRRGAAGDQVERSYGTFTNPYTKKHMVDVTNYVLAHEPRAFRIKILLQEMLTFEQKLTDSGQVQYPGAPANSGVWDDTVDGAMLALLADYDMPVMRTTPLVDPKAPAGPKPGHTRDIMARVKEMMDSRGFVVSEFETGLEEL